jgi:hypothetical protein
MAGTGPLLVVVCGLIVTVVSLKIQLHKIDKRLTELEQRRDV